MGKQLIDRENVLQGIEELKRSPFANPHDGGQKKLIQETLDIVACLCVKKEPTVEAEVVKHGKWIYGREVAREMQGEATTAVFYNDWHCSECGHRIGDKYTFISYVSYHYCPNCGARMDGAFVEDNNVPCKEGKRGK